MLSQVLQRDGTDRSVHEVLRRNLSRSTSDLEREAGPSRVPRRAVEPDVLAPADTVEERRATPLAPQMSPSTLSAARHRAEIDQLYRRPKPGGPAIGM